jgi:type VI secretion system protein ImpC
MADPKRTGPASAEVRTEEVSLLDQILDNVSPSDQPERRAAARDMVADFARQVLDGAMVYAKDTESMIKTRIAQLDGLISDQLNAVMHAPEFQRLEATWRGLHHLVQQSETGTGLKIKAFNTSKKDLFNDLDRAVEFDQSAIYKKVYEEEYGVFGGSPFGLLIGDYEFGNHSQDLALKIFDSVEYAKWKSFRESEDSRYIGLTLPHVLLREPYGRDTVPVESFNFEEDVSGKDATKYLWGNAAYMLGSRITDAFAQYGWCTAIRGVEGGGMVDGLPTHTFRTDEGDVALKCPTEISISERRELELANLGFISLVHCKGRDYAAFFSTQSANKPKKFDAAYANANARLSSQLQYIFAMSRFAHYLKAMMRDKVGSFMSRKNCEDFLNRWITQYVLLDDDAGQEAKARFPLREAKIEVEEVPGKPGVYRAITYMRPHFQLDELDISLRLVAELPPPRK